MGGGGQSSNSSSGEEDGDAEWRAAISSATSTATVFKHAPNSLPSSSNGGATHEDEDEKHKPQKLKLYQIKVFFFNPILPISYLWWSAKLLGAASK